jgi:acyl-coenzyme A thioesterase PaaI-like protein
MEAAEREANVDPLKILARETRKIEGEMRQQAAQTRRNDPLRFLTDKSFGATRAVNKILGDEDLILAAAARFGEKSPEFTALRQVWTEKVFRGTLEPGKRLEKVSPEVQRLMLGVNLETAQKLAEDMSFIMGGKSMARGDMAGGMAAMSKVEHPIAGKTISRAARLLPGANTAARATLGAYYSLMNKVLESPATARWLEKAYTGGEQHRAMVREELARILQRGGAIGSGAAQGAYQFGND